MRAAACRTAFVLLLSGCGGDGTTRLFVSPTGEVSPAVRAQLELPRFKRWMVALAAKVIPDSNTPNGSLERPYRRVQDALAAVPEVKRSLFHGGGEVLIDLMPGAYSESVIVRESGVRIEGLFPQNTRWESPIIEGDEVSIRVVKARGVSISSIRFAGSVTAVSVEDSALVVVSDNLFENFREAAVRISNTDGFKFTGNVVRHPASTGASKGLQADLRGSYARIAGNRIQGVESIGILLEAGPPPAASPKPGTKPRPFELRVEDNEIGRVRSHGLMIETPLPDRALKAVVRGNRIANAGGWGIACGEGGVALAAADNAIEGAALGAVMPSCALTELAPEDGGAAGAGF